MTKPLSSDLRERLIEAVAAGMSRRAAADRFGIAASTPVQWVRRFETLAATLEREETRFVRRRSPGDPATPRDSTYARAIAACASTGAKKSLYQSKSGTTCAIAMSVPDSTKIVW